jgi:hypothetical protein
MFPKLERFKEIWAVDTEYGHRPGDWVQPRCLVARELRTRRTVHWWEDDLARFRHPPHNTEADILFLAYAANAELGVYLQLGWALPCMILDLFAEFRQITNGLTLPAGDSLLGALAYFGHTGVDVTEKETMRQLAQHEGPWSQNQRTALLAYCESDVDALERLLPSMLPRIDLPRALLRGRYQRAVAAMERRGIPVDVPLRRRLEKHWGPLQAHLIATVSPSYNYCYSYHHDQAHFQYAPFTEWVTRQGIDWPRTRTGQVSLGDETLKELSTLYPRLVEPFRQLRKSLGQMRIHNMIVGQDGRNRPSLMPFRSKTGRNQPKTSENILGASAWLRGLIQPTPGTAIFYVDWVQQEFGIAGVKSNDTRMIEAYCSQDPYMAFAIAAGAVPPEATKLSHPREREIFKICSLGVLYGLSPRGLARKIGQSLEEGYELIRQHQHTYPTFWRWLDRAVHHSFTTGRISTEFGWQLRCFRERSYPHEATNPRTIRNYPMQALGADMMRIAACYAVERGVQVCCPVHDAFLCEAPLHKLEEAVATMQQAMSDASAAVLDGFRLRSDVKVFRHPAHYADGREVATAMWDTVNAFLAHVETTAA